MSESIKEPNDAEQTNKQDCCNKFWDAIERETGSQIPLYLRNILQHHGFNCAMSIKLIEEEDLDDIETMVTSGAFQSIFMDDTNAPEQFLGPFAKKPDSFRILRGYRKMLLSISNYISEKGPENVAKTEVKTPKSTILPEMFSTNSKTSAKSDTKRTTSTSQLTSQDSMKSIGSPQNCIDMNSEHDILFKKIKEWVLSYCATSYQKYKQKLTADTIVLKVVEPDESDPLPKLSATIKCPVCTHMSAISQQSKRLVGGSRGKLTWNICNFQSHYKIHVKAPVPKPHFAVISTVKSFGSSSSDVPPETTSIISDDGNEAESDLADNVNLSRKRKFNGISDGDDDDVDAESGQMKNAESGELLSGVLERQNTPEVQFMP